MRQIWFFVTIILIGIACKEIIPGPSPTPSPVPSATVAPSPTPTATPVPTVAPTATPSPSPSPVTGFKCPLPKAVNCAESTPNCCKEGGVNKFRDLIMEAHAELARLKPHFLKADGSIAVIDVEYTRELAKVFQDMFEICAVGGDVVPISHDEIGIKESNAEAVHVDVIIGGSRMPWSGGVYTCKPSAF